MTSGAAPGHIVWVKGGAADVLSLEGEALVLRSTVPFPPGARIEGEITVEPRAPVKVKSHGSHKEEDGTFTVKGRLLDATRELRERVRELSGVR